jgi:hypothetical protein
MSKGAWEPTGVYPEDEGKYQEKGLFFYYIGRQARPRRPPNKRNGFSNLKFGWGIPKTPSLIPPKFGRETVSGV